MSAGCAILASDTAPVREALTEDDTGWMVDFFDRAALVDLRARQAKSPG